MYKWTTLLVGAAVLVAAVAGCRGNRNAAVRLAGSTSVQPFAEKLAEEFMKKHPDIAVQVDAGGSTVGFTTLKDGTVDIGMSSREMTQEEEASKVFTAIPICRDGLAIVVNKANPVNALTHEQVRMLFTGQIANWKEVGGPDQAVALVTRENASGTRAAFLELVMGKDKVSDRATIQDSNGVVKESVKSNPSMIGYMSLGQVGGEVKALDIDGVKPTVEDILAGKYPLVRRFLFVTKGPLNAKAQAYVDFVLSEEGQKILESKGLIRK